MYSSTVGMIRCSRHTKRPGQAPSAQSTPPAGRPLSHRHPQPLLRDSTLDTIEKFSSREQTRRALHLVHTHTVRCVPSTSTSTSGTPATPDLTLAHHSTLPGHGKHPTTGGGGLRSASGYLSRRSKRRGIPVVVAATNKLQQPLQQNTCSTGTN